MADEVNPIQQMKCPACQAQPVTIAASISQPGPLTIASVWCAGCGTPLHIQILAVQQATGPSGPLIQVPRPPGRG